VRLFPALFLKSVSPYALIASVLDGNQTAASLFLLLTDCSRDQRRNDRLPCTLVSPENPMAARRYNMVAQVLCRPGHVLLTFSTRFPSVFLLAL
jgi:hypothetical protein